jgi:hypothetical protein
VVVNLPSLARDEHLALTVPLRAQAILFSELGDAGFDALSSHSLP